MTIISWRSLRPFVPIPFLRWLHLGGDPVRDVRLARSRSARRSDPTDPGITRGYDLVIGFPVGFVGTQESKERLKHCLRVPRFVLVLG